MVSDGLSYTVMPSAAAAEPLIDCHFHCVDFSQQSPGGAALLAALDQTGLAKAVIMGLPLIQKESDAGAASGASDPRYFYYTAADQVVADLVADLPAAGRHRVAPLICGFNPADEHAVHRVAYLLKRHSFWRGVGEILLRHDRLSRLTVGETAYATHPAMLPVYQLCSDRGLPIIVHQNSNSEAANEGDEYVGEVETVLSQFPRLH